MPTRKAKKSINYMAVVALVLALLGAFGGGYAIGSAKADGCAQRLSTMGANSVIVDYVCSGRVPQQ